MYENKESVPVTEQKCKGESCVQESWVVPSVDIYETGDDFFLDVLLPGVQKDKLEVKIENGILEITGKKNETSRENRKYVLKEIEEGNYYRKFRLSDSVDVEKVDAQFEHGRLILRLPKHENAKPKAIQIK